MDDFARCYRAEKPTLVRFLMNQGANNHEADDAAQAAFVSAWRNWETIRAPRSWLRTVALHEYYRSPVRAPARERPVETVPDITQAPPAAEAAELSEQTRRVRVALETLPAKQRQTMALHFDGFGPAEIAEQLGAEAATVRQSLRKARTNLKKALGISEKDK